jgi:hypothetical protein
MCREPVLVSQEENASGLSDVSMTPASCVALEAACLCGHRRRAHADKRGVREEQDVYEKRGP